MSQCIFRSTRITLLTAFTFNNFPRSQLPYTSSKGLKNHGQVQILLFFKLLFIFYEFHIIHPNSTYLPISRHLPLQPQSKTKFKKIKYQKKLANQTKHTKQNKKDKKLWKLQGVPVSHTVHYLVLSSSVEKGHCHESLLWFEATSICYTTDDGLLLCFLKNTMLSCVVETLKFWICRFVPFSSR